jgi:hypothetical protein
VARAAERSQQRGNHGHIVDRCVQCLFQIPLEESRGNAAPTLRLLLADERGEQQELFGARSTDLAKRRLGDEKVSSLECSSEYRSRVPLGGDFLVFLSWGRSDASLPG